jgi:hypothetical protein
MEWLGRHGGRTLKDAGDTKRGALVGIDRYGNKFFENLEEELPRMSQAGDEGIGAR